MTTPLLTTKLYIPPPRPNLVPRPRLVERLNAGLRRKLTLVSAPAGSGKTTLVAEWLHGTERVAWLSLDASDNDPMRFWAGVIAALQTVASDVGTDAQDILHTSPPPPSESVLTALINELCAAPFIRPVTLTLDDYHTIDTPAIHQAVAFLLDHLPPQMHLVILTRTDPPLPLARLRARGQMVEIRTADLRFSPDETATFLKQAMGLNLSAEDVAVLAARTEGWIAGLQMAALSLQGQDDVSHFVRAFSGSHHFILDYLMDEVLSHQSEEVQAFLLRTSILERMTGPLCDAVCALEAGVTGQAKLEMLQRANLFIVPLDIERRWYRYHHLFAELLRHRLHRQAGSPSVASLHRRAAEWYEENDLAVDAVHHALAGGDFEWAACLIEANVDAMLQRNEIATVLRWLDALPPELVHARPYLCIARAWVLIANAHFDEAEGWARNAESALRIAGKRAVQSASATGETEGITVQRMKGHIDAIRATVANSLRDDTRAIALARRALENLPADDVLLRGILALDLGEAFARRNDLEAAERTFTEAIVVNRAAGNVAVTLNLMSSLGALQARQGDLDRAAATYRQAIQLGSQAGRPSGYPVPATGIAHVLMACLLYERDDLDTALHHATLGIAYCKRWGHLENLINGYDALAQVQFAQGDVEQAPDTVTQALALIKDTLALVRQTASPARIERLSGEIRRLEALRALFWLMEGNLDAVGRWVQERGISDADSPCYSVLARLCLARNELEKARLLLNKSLQEEGASMPVGPKIPLLALQACAFQAQGDSTRAMAALEQALLLGEPGGYVRTFVEIGTPMQDLLRQPTARGIAPAYVDRLLAAFGRPALPHPPAPALVEPLSPRELEVLHLIATDLPNQEIADRLYISLNTVKTHVRRLYAKLHAHSRLQAVERARELGLLRSTRL
jgi:LuxR family maltose regulon positive regulatory protein